ncbi:MAG: hypothetical protein KA375_08935 [Vitreoscilla sp.]|nr:hypothetical protein [Burkholderiales bacterium]MBP6337707.1 hypothetical protein [Vitreoscilla sp.]MBP6674387.1 hypothetical protein [Vitreoscilla sp.]
MTSAPVASPLDELTGAVMAAHARNTQGALARLVTEAPPLLPHAPGSELEAFLRAAEHIALGHADDSGTLQDLLAALSAQQARHPALAQALQRAQAALALADDLHTELLAGLPAAERVRAHYNAALARTRRRDFAAALQLVDAATAHAAAGDEPAQRALAALTNNLAADLHEYLRPGDTAAATLMLEAAHRAHGHWARGGGWLEVERADWQLAMCAAAAGDGPRALGHARAGLAACGANNADDYEFCFAWQALAVAALAAGEHELAREARNAMAQRLTLLTDEGDRAYGTECLAKIDHQLA